MCAGQAEAHTQLQEEPLVATLDHDLEGKGTHCSHCLRHIQKGMAITPDSDRLNSVYCSKDCQLKSKVHSQHLLFSLDPYLPPELDGGVVGEMSSEKRDAAQQALAEFFKKQRKAAPVLSARFVARQVALETAKMIPGQQSSLADLPKFVEDGNDYGMYDHIERLRFVEGTVEEEELQLLRDVFASTLPGLESAVNDEQYALWKGKMLYNAFGVCYGGGRDDKVCSLIRDTRRCCADIGAVAHLGGTSRRPGADTYTVRNVASSRLWSLPRLGLRE